MNDVARVGTGVNGGTGVNRGNDVNDVNGTNEVNGGNGANAVGDAIKPTYPRHSETHTLTAFGLYVCLSLSLFLFFSFVFFQCDSRFLFFFLDGRENGLS